MNQVVDDSTEVKLDIRNLLEIVKRRAWLVIAVMMVIFASVFILLQLSGSTYEATRRIRPSESILKPPGDTGMGMNPFNPTDERMRRLATLVEMASNPAVTDDICKTTFRDLYGSNAPVFANQTVISHMKLEREDIEKMIRDGKIKATIVPVSMTNKKGPQANDVVTDLIEFSVEDKDKDNAKYLVDALTQAFKKFYETTSKQPLAEQVSFYKARLVDTRKAMLAAGDKLRSLRVDRNLADFDKAITYDYSVATPVRTQLEAIASSLAGTVSSLAVKEAQLNKMKSTMPDDAGKSATTLEMEKELAAAQTQYASGKSKYADGHPTMQEYKRRIVELEARIKDEKKNLPLITNPAYYSLKSEVDNLRAKRADLSSQLGSLNTQLKSIEGRISSFKGLDVDIQEATDDYARASQAYTDMFGRYSAALLNLSATDKEFIYTLGPARVEGPIKAGPNPKLAYVGALFLAVLMGVGFAVLVDMYDNSVKTSDDVERLLGLPVTGVIPALEGGAPSDLSKITYLAPSSPYAEAYRFVSEDIIRTLKENPDIKSIMGATARPGQGGTTTITNLAITLAQGGMKVILVDGDMRHPKLHRVFGVDNEAGLSTVLSNENLLTEALRETDIQNLMVLPGGPVPRNAWLLLRSERMTEVMSELETVADVVLIDTPSAAVFADATVYASVVDAVVVIVRANQPPRGNETRIREMLNKNNLRHLGVVLNDANQETVESYHFNNHYYRYYRPEGEEALPAPTNRRARKTKSMRRMVAEQNAQQSPSELPTASPDAATTTAETDAVNERQVMDRSSFNKSDKS